LSPHPKVIFVDEEVQAEIEKSYQLDRSCTRLVDVRTVPLVAPEPDWIVPLERNADKDSREYLRTINSKTHFVTAAADLNPFETDQFVWVDFGIFHIFKRTRLSLRRL